MNFMLIVLIIVVSAYLIIWWRLVLTSKLSKRWQWALGLIFILLFMLQVGTRFLLHRKFSAAFHSPLTLIVFGLLGFTDILLFFTLSKELFNFFIKMRRNNSDPERRLFIQRSLNLAAVGIAGGATAWGTKTALAGPQIKKVTVPLKNLHQDLNGLRIAQISDLHVGSIIQKKQVEHIVDMVQSLDPDLIFLTGDLADGDVEGLKEATQPLEQLKARWGKFYVTGNHEYYWDVDDWTQRAKDLGFDYLYNEHRILNIAEAKLVIGGVADFMCARIRPDHKTDPVGSLRGAPLSDFKILLAHQPKSCFQAFQAGYDLQVSGHTHNGQFFPNNLIIGFFHPYVKGLNLHENKMWVYVNSGTGFWGPAQRLGIPGEITLLTLTT